MLSEDSLKTLRVLQLGQKEYNYYSLQAAIDAGLKNIVKLPFSLKILLENLLRFEDKSRVCQNDITILANWSSDNAKDHEIAFRPARILMQDFTGVPAIVDLAAMRDAMNARGK